MFDSLLSPARLLAMIPDDVRGVAAAVAEVGAAADVLGLPDPPAVWWPLWEREGARVGLPPELLAALSGILAGYRPDAREDGRGGLMGYPGAGDDRRASVEALLARDPAAVAAVEATVRDAAEWIAKARVRGGLGRAIAEYVAAGFCGVGRAENDRCRREMAAVVGAFMVFLARRVPRERFDLLRELIGGSHG